MKWLRTLVLFDQGNIANTEDWNTVHESYVRSIQNVDFPKGSGKLTLRRKIKRPDGQWARNGVKFLKSSFFDHLTDVEEWQPEKTVDLNREREQAPIMLHPSGEKHNEPVMSNFGSFDFVTDAPNGLRVAIEWETGNISSSHRSMNKLAISLQNGIIGAGVLVLPSRLLYEHLTDRIGNIDELSGYLSMWAGLSHSVENGLLAVSVVEHDDLTNDPNFSYLPSGSDGRAREGLAKRR